MLPHLLPLYAVSFILFTGRLVVSLSPSEVDIRCIFGSKHQDSHIFERHKEELLTTLSGSFPAWYNDSVSGFVRRSIACFQSGDMNTAFEHLDSTLKIQWGMQPLWSPTTEKYMWEISRRYLTQTKYVEDVSNVHKILHVGTEFYNSGGHTRVVLSFFENLPNLKQALFITNKYGNVPDLIRYSTIPNLRDNIYLCDARHGDYLACAQRVRDTAVDYDLVVLHIHTHDFISTIAFGEGYYGPRVVLFDHADHLPWIGSSVLDARLVYRHTAAQLASSRGLDPSRTIRMPLPASVSQSPFQNKEECRRRLGISENQVVLLTMASTYKYGNLLDFINIIIRILKRYSTAYFVAVGVPSVWLTHAENQGVNMSQVRYIRRIGDAALAAMYHIAADIHIDSFPFSSITSMIETTLISGVAVTLCPWTEEQDMILCAHPGDFGLPSFNSSFSDMPFPIISYRTKHAFECGLQSLVAFPNILEASMSYTSRMMGMHTSNQWGDIMTKVLEDVLKFSRRPANNKLDSISLSSGKYECVNSGPILAQLGFHIEKSGSNVQEFNIFRWRDNGLSLELQLSEYCVNLDLHYPDCDDLKIIIISHLHKHEEYRDILLRYAEL